MDTVKLFGLNTVLIELLLYSILTQNEGLEVYSNTIAALVEKDKPWAKGIENEVKILTKALFKQQRIT